MTRIQDREDAIKMRRAGASYSQIKEKLGISKSTLSGWLANFPLSKERIRILRDMNPRRIENFRNTMKQKRDARFFVAYKDASKAIGRLSARDLFIAGLFLYWGEGDKHGGVFALSNTDPNVIRFFMKWARSLGIPEEKFKVVLHLYSDMNESDEKKYWSDITNIPLNNFRKSYVKDSKLTGLTYKTSFRHGTCMIRVHDTKLTNFILMSLKYLGDIA